jgi:chromosomal replication initiation ATPase DnaA
VISPAGRGLGQGKTKKDDEVTSQETKNKIDQVWVRVRERLKLELGQQRFQYWVEPLRVSSAEGGRVVIACTSRFERDKVVESHGERIANLIAELAPEFAAVDFTVDSNGRVT